MSEQWLREHLTDAVPPPPPSANRLQEVAARMTRQQRRRARATIVSICLVVASVAVAGEQFGRQHRETSPTPSASASIQLSCGGQPPGWPVSAMNGGIDNPADVSQLRDALEALVKKTGVDAPKALQNVAIANAPWFVLAETSGTATVATGNWNENGPGEDGQIVMLDKSGGQWRTVGWGDCKNLAPVIGPGLQWVTITAPPELDRSSSELSVRVNEVACTSGRDPRPFLREPTIVEDDKSVTISWASDAPHGQNSCPGNRPVLMVLHLKQPLGDRVLLDGSHWPARPIVDNH